MSKKDEEYMCEYCNGVGRREGMFLHSDGDPRYYFEDCICQAAESPVTAIKAQLDTILKGIQNNES